MGNPVIISACRTPGGKFGGSLKPFDASDLGAYAVSEAIKRSGVSYEDIDEVILGIGWQAGVGANPARIALYRAGLPQSIPAFSINKRCGSGIKSVMLAADKIRLGDSKVIVAGGMESASNVPYLLPDARWGHRMGEKRVPDALHRDGFICPISNVIMGTATEQLVEDFHISRQEQDEFTLRSHLRAIDAIDNGNFQDEIIPVTIKDRKKGDIIFDTDEIPRRDTSLEKLSKLPAIFKENGTITAGSSSALCDAGCAIIVADEDWARSQGYTILAKIIGYASGALDARYFGLGPVISTPKALDKAGLNLGDMDLIELNEAFAAQVLAVHRKMSFDLEKCNIYGGAIALGHPVGATGAKILTTLIYALKNRDLELGLATACIGGGQGVSIVIQR